MLSLQLGRFADARLAKQCQCAVSLQIGQRPQHVRAEMIVDGIAQESGVREIERTGLRNPETLPVISNVMILNRNGHDRFWRAHRTCFLTIRFRPGAPLLKLLRQPFGCAAQDRT